MTTHEIIDEVAGFYKLGNRSVKTESHFCLYNGPDGKQCAFARMVIDPLALIEHTNARVIIQEFGMQILKPEYRGHDAEFYIAVQRLHDNKGNWNEDGLSEEGKIKVIDLKIKYPV